MGEVEEKCRGKLGAMRKMEKQENGKLVPERLTTMKVVSYIHLWQNRI